MVRNKKINRYAGLFLLSITFLFSACNTYNTSGTALYVSSSDFLSSVDTLLTVGVVENDWNERMSPKENIGRTIDTTYIIKTKIIGNRQANRKIALDTAANISIAGQHKTVFVSDSAILKINRIDSNIDKILHPTPDMPHIVIKDTLITKETSLAIGRDTLNVTPISLLGQNGNQHQQNVEEMIKGDTKQNVGKVLPVDSIDTLNKKISEINIKNALIQQKISNREIAVKDSMTAVMIQKLMLDSLRISSKKDIEVNSISQKLLFQNDSILFLNKQIENVKTQKSLLEQEIAVIKTNQQDSLIKIAEKKIALDTLHSMLVKDNTISSLSRKILIKSDTVNLLHQQLNNLNNENKLLKESIAANGIKQKDTGAKTTAQAIQLQSQVNNLVQQNEQLKTSITNIKKEIDNNRTADSRQQAQVLTDISKNIDKLIAAANQSRTTVAAEPAKIIVSPVNTIIKETITRDTIINTVVKTDTIVKTKLIENESLKMNVSELQDSVSRLQTLVELKNKALTSVEGKIIEQGNRQVDTVKITAYYAAGKIYASNEGLVLKDLHSKIGNRKIDKITLIGYTDSSGSPSLNLKLSNQRVVRLIDKLIQLGYDRDIIFLQFFGSRYASDKIIENERRVEIVTETAK